VGVTGWIATTITLPFFLTLTRQRTSTSAAWIVTFCVLLLAQWFFFFWGANHLAKGKGYSTLAILLGVLPCLQPIVMIGLFAMSDRNPAASKSKRRGRRESSIERVVRCRRNAILGNSFGAFGILVAMSLVLFPLGISEDDSNEIAIALMIFLAGYAGVIVGCFWWARAKGWPDGIVFIALMPLVPFLVPYVRIILIQIVAANPDFILIPMIMAPIVLLVIMFVLPDKSGIPKRKNRGLSDWVKAATKEESL
jgi:hypothetical protein